MGTLSVSGVRVNECIARDQGSARECIGRAGEVPRARGSFRAAAWIRLGRSLARPVYDFSTGWAFLAVDRERQARRLVACAAHRKPLTRSGCHGASLVQSIRDNSEWSRRERGCARLGLPRRRCFQGGGATAALGAGVAAAGVLELFLASATVSEAARHGQRRTGRAPRLTMGVVYRRANSSCLRT